MRLIKLITENNHWNIYSKIIETALEKNYRIINLKEYWQNREKYKNTKVFILRHDVDHNPKDALKMFLIEKNYGVKSTFYFRWYTMEESVIRTIKENNFEIGLHFETIATYAKAKNINVITKKDLEICKKILETEITRFKLLFGTLDSICSHGAPENRKLKLANNILVDKNMKEKYNIFEAYDINTDLDSYISDGDHTIKLWRYNNNPILEMKKNKEKICLLTHPTHWGKNIIKRIVFKSYRKLFKQSNI